MDDIKKKLGEAAANLIQDGFIVGLGTGSTANYFIECLGKRCRKNLKIQAVASSDKSYRLAKESSIEILDINDIDKIDVYVDGADEVDSDKNMIKGKGGAFLKEKMLLTFAKKAIILIDETKLVHEIGKAKLPLEILPFGSKLTQKRLEKLGYIGEFRKNKSENGNLILDVIFGKHLDDPIEHQKTISTLPGVLETGLFLDINCRIMVGKSDGSIEFID